MYSGGNHAKRQKNKRSRGKRSCSFCSSCSLTCSYWEGNLKTPECSEMTRPTILQKEYASSQYLFHQEYIELILAGTNIEKLQILGKKNHHKTKSTGRVTKRSVLRINSGKAKEKLTSVFETLPHVMIPDLNIGTWLHKYRALLNQFIKHRI